MINWFMALTTDHQSLAILMTVVVIEAIVIIIGANCPRKAAKHDELQQEQEKLVGKIS